MSRIVALIYGLVAYAVFFATFLYAVGFVGGWAVPKTIDTGLAAPVGEALIVNLVLLTIFALQHSVMARPAFKRVWTLIVPPAVERSTYVLLASLALILVFWQWRPLPATVWQVADPTLAMALVGLSLFGWSIVLFSSFLINHFELFGLSQVILNLKRRTPEAPKFRTPLLYRFVRHPLYLGFIIAFWATPTMTLGHLLFAAVTTTYILVAIVFEEHDLTELFGDDYRRYRQRVAMLIPFWPASSAAGTQALSGTTAAASRQSVS